jgi:hypothetical protein
MNPRERLPQPLIPTKTRDASGWKARCVRNGATAEGPGEGPYIFGSLFEVVGCSGLSGSRGRVLGRARRASRLTVVTIGGLGETGAEREIPNAVDRRPERWSRAPWPLRSEPISMTEDQVLASRSLTSPFFIVWQHQGTAGASTAETART